MNRRLENKINRWYGKGIATRVWIAKHWHRWITYGCPMCWRECGGHGQAIDDCRGYVLDLYLEAEGYGSINSPKGFAEMAEYCYDNYGEVYKR